MILLGITGPIGHGKSTLVQTLHDIEPSSRSVESSRLIAGVADYINQQLIDGGAGMDAVIARLSEAIRHVTPLQFEAELLKATERDKVEYPDLYHKLDVYLGAVAAEPRLLGQRISADNKEDYRSLLQWIGGFVTIKLGRSLWYEELARQAGLSAAEGCRLFMFGGVRFPGDAAVIRGAGGSIIEIVRPERAVRDGNDLTESARQDLQADVEVINNGSLAQLHRLAGQLYDDAQRHTLSRSYQAIAY